MTLPIIQPGSARPAATPEERAIAAAFAELAGAPGYQGAVLIMVTGKDTVRVRSTYPGHMLEQLIHQLATQMRGERSGLVIVPGNT